MYPSGQVCSLQSQSNESAVWALLGTTTPEEVLEGKTISGAGVLETVCGLTPVPGDCRKTSVRNRHNDL